MMRVHVPRLGEKLAWLRGPKRLSLGDLAEELKIAPSNIAGWIHGTPTTPPNHVPVKYLLPSPDYKTLCTIFDIPYTAFETVTMEEFKKQIDGFRKSRIERHSAPWTRLLEQAKAAPELQIIGNRPRGVRDPDDPPVDFPDPDTPSFSVGDGIMFRVTYPGRWHGLLLIEDPRRQWSRLWPRQNISDTGFENEFSFPHQSADAPKRFGEIEKPPGTNRVVAIITNTGAPLDRIRDLQVYPITTEHLDEMAAELSQLKGKDPNSCVFMTKWFYAGPA